MKAPIVTVTGYTGGEPELRYFNDGTAFASVRAAWSQDRPDGTGGWIKDHETWVTIEWRGKSAEHTADLGIGTGELVRVTGALYMDSYTRRDGSPGQTLKLRADGTPKHWTKDDRGGQRPPAGRAGQAPPAAAPETTPPAGPAGPIGGARHDDPPF